MHEINIRTEKQRIEGQNRTQKEIDRFSLQKSIEIEKQQYAKRAQAAVDFHQRNVEYEKKVAVAAKGITREREIEKEKLTSINVNKAKLVEEQRAMREHHTQIFSRQKTTKVLTTELQRQMLERRDVTAIERRQDAAQMAINKRLDAAHWENEEKVHEARKQKRLAHERELLVQIEARRQSAGSGDLHINKDYINNIKQIKNQLQDEITM